MLRFLKYSLLSFAVSGLLILPGYAQPSAGNTGKAGQSSQQHLQVSGSQSRKAEQSRVTAEGESWTLKTSSSPRRGGGGEGGAGR